MIITFKNWFHDSFYHVGSRSLNGSGHKTALLVLLFIFLGIVLPAHGMEEPEAELPLRSFQGGTVFVRIPSGGFKKVELEFGKKKIPAYPAKSGYLAVIGIPADLKEGDYALVIRAGGEGGLSTEKRVSLKIEGKFYGEEKITLPPAKKGLPESPKLKDANKIVRQQLFIESPERFWSGSFVKPAAGRISASFGIRRLLDGKTDWGYHSGVDFIGKKGDEVFAPAPGKVLLARELEVFGKTIVLDHGQGVVSIFQHLSKFEVKEGELCEPGEKIGEIGSTGLATGPHLHWGLYLHGTKVDPLQWLSLPAEVAEERVTSSLISYQ